MKITKRKNIKLDAFIDLNDRKVVAQAKINCFWWLGLAFVILSIIVFWVFVVSMDLDYLYLSFRVLLFSVPFYLVYYFKIEL